MVLALSHLLTLRMHSHSWRYSYVTTVACFVIGFADIFTLPGLIVSLWTQLDCAVMQTRQHIIDGKKVEAKAAVPRSSGSGNSLTKKMFVGGTVSHFAQKRIMSSLQPK